ncbi:MAG: metallophosphoesterase family protein [Nocardioides sp.]
MAHDSERRIGLGELAGLWVVWLVLSAVAATWLFFSSERTMVIASHDAIVRPTMTGKAVLHTGPLLPDIRRDSGGRLGVDILLGKTEAATTTELLQRYALIASQPEAQIDKVREGLYDMALASLWRGALIGAVPVAAWLLVGGTRRRELWNRFRDARRRDRALIAGSMTLVVVSVATVVLRPLLDTEPRSTSAAWEELRDFLGPAVPVPAEATGVQVRSSVTTRQTRRLIASAVDTYDRSKVFYAAAEEAAGDLELRESADDETVAVLVSDRHDNIGMDPVVRAIADAGGATAILNAGDDTSSGESWEAFSLDSLEEEFSDYDRFHVAGNHDSGTFVSRYLEDLGWTVLDGEVVDGPGGTRLIGVADPRSSGLGTWRDETGLSLGEQSRSIADDVCAAEERINVLMVHDPASGGPTLGDGCVDLVIGGHLHVQVGPSAVKGRNGETGYSYTNGTTGGAAYAIAVGSKLRREAQVTLITFRDRRPVGLQPVKLQTNGVFVVEPYLELEYPSPDESTQSRKTRGQPGSESGRQQSDRPGS